MQTLSFKLFLIGTALLICAVQAQEPYPYTSSQAVFVQSPYNSSLYTNYNYNPYQTAPQRLPSYTTNQAVFVQRPYATAQQTVTSFPSNYSNSLPSTENRYTSPSAYPSTVAPAYPYGTVGNYVSSPYTTTNQTPTYRYPYSGTDYTTTYTYPYTTSTQTTQYPPPVIERVPTGYAYPNGVPNGAPIPQGIPSSYPASMNQGYPSTTYNAYPISTSTTYPYPTTTTAVPEVIVEPVKPAPAPIPRRGP